MCTSLVLTVEWKALLPAFYSAVNLKVGEELERVRERCWRLCRPQRRLTLRYNLNLHLDRVLLLVILAQEGLGAGCNCAYVG